MNPIQQAEKSVAQYDAYVFASVGRTFDADKADLLAFYAADELASALAFARKTNEPQWFIARLQARQAEFAAIK